MLSLLREALANLLLHRGRTSLATLGIVFGVASVICMLSISEVARRDVIERIQRLGVRNVIIDSVKPERVRSREQAESNGGFEAAYGLTVKEYELLEDAIGPSGQQPAVVAMSPMRIIDESVRAGANSRDVNVVATNAGYSRVMSHPVAQGRFLAEVDGLTNSTVCVLGAKSAKELFPLASPVGQVVEVGDVPFRVVGVMTSRGQTGSSGILSDPDRAVWMPFETAAARFGVGEYRAGRDRTVVEIHRAVLQARSDELLGTVASVVDSMLGQRHVDGDYAVTIPSALVDEQQQAEDVFRWVMASLAAIALLVGGVGIMNIMLANMAERRHEIGLRRAIGATRGAIIRLFLSESTVICAFGSLLGVALGAGLAHLIGRLANWTVVFEPIAFPLGVCVGVVTGLVFGTVPAVKAARMDPVLALRGE